MLEKKTFPILSHINLFFEQKNFISQIKEFMHDMAIPKMRCENQKLIKI